MFSLEEIRMPGTMLNTNKAFGRYLRTESNDSKNIYLASRNLLKVKEEGNKKLRVTIN